MNFTFNNIFWYQSIGDILLFFKKKIHYLIIFISLLLFTLAGRAQVVINELGIAPTSGNAGGGGEFIELFNKGGCTVDLSCYVLVYSSTSGTGNPTGWTITIPSGKSIAACGYFLIGGGGFPGSFTSSWGNSSIGGSAWLNTSGTQGNNTADLDISTSNNSSRQSTVPGNLTDPQGQVTLYNASGVVVSSVSYNTGNNSGSYPAISNRPTGCTGTNSFSDPSQTSNDVIAEFFSGSSNRKRGIYLDENGVYQSAINFTPGKQNNLAGGTQLPCAPTITTASSAVDVCYSSTAQTTTLTYSGVTNSPVTYSIVWDASPANSFVNVTNATLPSSPISITVPAGTPAGTYTGNITVANSSGVVSCPSLSFTVTVKPNPTPTITGAATACINTAGNVYTTEAGKSNYVWVVNGGTITSGGTSTNNTATVTWTSTGAKSISVNYTDTNGCSAASPTVYTVTVNPKPSPIIYHN